MDAGFRAWSSAARYPSSFHCDKQVPTLKYMVAFLRCFSGCLRQVGTYRYLSTYPRTYLGTPHMLPTVPQGAFKSPGHRRPPMQTRDFTTHALRTAITKAVKKTRRSHCKGRPANDKQNVPQLRTSHVEETPAHCNANTTASSRHATSYVLAESVGYKSHQLLQF